MGQNAPIYYMSAPNGAGKSLAAEHASSSQFIDAQPNAFLATLSHSYEDLLLLPQGDQTTFLASTVLDSISMAAATRGLAPAAARRTAEHLLDQFNFTDLLKREIATLSGGEEQLIRFLSFYIVAQHNPRALLILDDPLAMLDRQTASNLLSILKSVENSNTINCLRCAILMMFPANSEAYRAASLGLPITWTAPTLAPISENHLACLRNIAACFSEHKCYPYTWPSFSTSLSKERTITFPSGNFVPGTLNIISGPNGSGKSLLIRRLIDGNAPSPPFSAAMLPQQIWRLSGYLVSALEKSHLSLIKIWYNCYFSSTFNSDAEFYHAIKYWGYGTSKVLSLLAFLSIVLIQAGRQWIVLDEPDSGLDGRNLMSLSALIQTLVRCGVNIVLITHLSDFWQLIPNVHNVKLH